jgi:hypothetical protein
MYALSIQYNDHAPFTAKSRVHAGLGLSFYNSDQGFVHLRVMVKRAEHDESEYWLKTIRPGDRLRISYRLASPLEAESIAGIANCERIGETYEIPHGQRIGFDVDMNGREAVRLSHPPEGSFIFILGNIPLTHARCQVMAENETEDWQWQLADLFVDSSIGLTFVETSWNTPFPRITVTPDSD